MEYKTSLSETENQKYLIEGLQTRVTPEIKQLSKSFREEDKNLLGEILGWIKSSFKFKNDESITFSRTAEEIIKSGFITGCQDEGIIFVTICKALDIPASYIQAKKKVGKLQGHVFSRVFLNHKIYFVDPSRKTISESKNFGNYIPVREGLDSWDIGIKSLDDLERTFSQIQ